MGGWGTDRELKRNIKYDLVWRRECKGKEASSFQADAGSGVLLEHKL